MRPCKDRILRGIGGVAGVEAHADGVSPGRLHHVAELAGKEVHRAVVLDGNLDAQVLREWRDQAQNTQQLVHVLFEGHRSDPVSLLAEQAADDR
jgi:hypothetical protein